MVSSKNVKITINNLQSHHWGPCCKTLTTMCLFLRKHVYSFFLSSIILGLQLLQRPPCHFDNTKPDDPLLFPSGKNVLCECYHVNYLLLFIDKAYFIQVFERQPPQQSI